MKRKKTCSIKRDLAQKIFSYAYLAIHMLVSTDDDVAERSKALA